LNIFFSSEIPLLHSYPSQTSSSSSPSWSQDGFVKSESIVTNLLYHINKVTYARCSQGLVVSVRLYLNQAFDEVPHNLLFNKLHSFKPIRYIVWFHKPDVPA
jgi:hypothetical protein